MESRGQCVDNEENEANSQATSRSRPNTRQRAKESHLAGHNTNTCSSETRFFLSWLYKNFAFNSVTKGTFKTAKPSIESLNCELQYAGGI